MNQNALEILSKLRVNKETTASNTQQTLMIHPRNQHMNGKVGKAMTQNTERRIFLKMSPCRNENVEVLQSSNSTSKTFQRIFAVVEACGIVIPSPLPIFFSTETVTGRKARGLQMEETGCKCQTFFSSLLSGRRKQTTSVTFFPLLYTNLKPGFF